MTTIEQKRNEWDALLQKQALLQQEKEALLAYFHSEGYTVVDGALVPNKTTWAVEWSFDYYSRYVGEVGAMYDRFSGCVALTDEQYEQVFLAMTNQDEEFFKDFFYEIAELEEYLFYGMFKYGQWTADKIHDDKQADLLWEINKDRGQEALDIGSYFRLARMTQEAIQTIPMSVIKNDI